MENIKLILKGLIIGIGKIIPGVSGAMLAISLGIYEKGLHVLSNLKKELKDNIGFIFFLGVGILLSLVFGSKLVKFSLENYYLPTMLLFIGMIVGGIKPLFTKVKEEKTNIKNILITISVIVLLILISKLNYGQDKTLYNKDISSFLTFFAGGLLDAAATVIPGISGTALLMILGCYGSVITAFSDLFNIANIGDNLFVLIPFGIGMIVGVLVIAKIMNYLFSNHQTKTYYAIIGFAIASVILLILQTVGSAYSVIEIIISLVLFVVGYFVSLKLDR